MAEMKREEARLPEGWLKEDKMQGKPVIYLVAIGCVPEWEERFNSWYDETHIPIVLKSKWLQGVTRYKLAPVTQGEYPEYLAIYEFEDRQASEAFFSGPELHAAREEMQDTWADKKAFEIKWRVVYEPLKAWHK